MEHIFSKIWEGTIVPSTFWFLRLCRQGWTCRWSAIWVLWDKLAWNTIVCLWCLSVNVSLVLKFLWWWVVESKIFYQKLTYLKEIIGFGWFLKYKIEFEIQILALFVTLSFMVFTKYNNFLWICLFLSKNLF